MSEEKIPELTLTPMIETAEEEKRISNAPAVRVEDTPLTEAESRAVAAFSEKIDISNSAMVLQYGSEAQRKMADFSGGALDSVRSKDLGEVGDMLTNLIGELKDFDATEEKGFLGLFRKGWNKIEAMKLKYNKVEVNVDKISGMLEDHQVTLLKDIAILDQLYQKNLTNFKELTMYIIAGKQKLETVRKSTLQQKIDKAKQSGLPEDAQDARDFSELCERFEKKLYDLELTRQVSIQMAPQIRLIQNNDSLMAEKIQSTIMNTIPLWKNQMVIALGIAHSREAMEAQRRVTDMTNELLKKNMDALKAGTIETAKEAERGIIDVETLKYTNQQLISTLDEVVKIQDEGRVRRRQAETELAQIEGDIRQKLLDIRNAQ